MTAPLFLLSDGALATIGAGDQVLLDGEEGRHAATVRRIGAGEQVLVADGSGLIAHTTVEAVHDRALTLRVASVQQAPVQQPRLILVQALAKGGRDDAAIEAATELGVDEVIPWQAERSIVQWRGERAAKGVRQWTATVRAAAKQSRRPTVPVVGDPLTGRAVTSVVTPGRRVLVLHEEAGTSLADALPDADEIAVVVGPEGGISPAELDALVEAGAQPVLLGPHVLRASTAGPAALAVICARTRW